MRSIGEFSADGYGIVILSTDLLNDYLKEKKCRAKKLISYLNKNREFFFQMIKDARILPFYKIASDEYEIFITVNEHDVMIPADYQEVFRYEAFYLEVGQLNRICFASFDYLEYHMEKIKPFSEKITALLTKTFKKLITIFIVLTYTVLIKS